MSLKKNAVSISRITLVVFVAVVFVSILPILTKVYAGLKTYKTQVAYRDDYKLHTTPLTKKKVEDICLKLGIKASSESCKPDAVVYAPELFDEIKTYFYDLPKNERTKDIVQNRLGAYLVYCEHPDADGYYRCRYDLRGDKVYPVFFLFDKDDVYYEIIANVGGS